uniref:hypothetical protein n=1 Tax=Nonomuraea sp. CA-251285 TaxID=3240002 RepID=UPI003F493875
MLTDRSDTLYIESTRDQDKHPVCQLHWGQLDWYANVEDIRETALDLVSCAAIAEQMMMLVKIGLDAAVVSEFMSNVISRSRPKGRRFFGTESTVRLTPGGSSRRGEAVVLIERGKKRGAVSPAEARTIAGDWFGAAEATESDQMVTEALQSVGKFDEGWVAGFFDYLRHLRSDTPVAASTEGALKAATEAVR